MRVLYDSSAFDCQRVGGISRYFTELISNLRRLKLAKARTSFFLTENQHLSEKGLFPVVTLPAWMSWRHKSYYKARINKLTTKWALRHDIADVFHMTFYDLSLLPLIDCPFIVTVYDMIPELFPQLFEDPASVHPGKKEICERAHAVICISHTTRLDLIRLFNIDPGKIFVTPLGIRPDWNRRLRPLPGLPPSFVLFVGRRSGYKNFEQLADALGRLAPLHPELNLVCAGGGPFSESELDILRRKALLSRVRQFDVTDQQLAYCYSKAAAFVFPSLYEGFGIPILEAFLSRCPVLLASRSCFPEIAADAAAYFDPDQPDSLALALDRLLQDRQQRQPLIERGAKRVADFTWKKTAVETARIYDSLR